VFSGTSAKTAALVDGCDLNRTAALVVALATAKTLGDAVGEAEATGVAAGVGETVELALGEVVGVDPAETAAPWTGVGVAGDAAAALVGSGRPP